MNEVHIHHLEMLHWLWLTPLLAGLLAYGGARRRRALTALIGAGLLERVRIAASPVRRRWKGALLLAGIVFIILGLTRPAWNLQPRAVERKGRDVVFLLDLSQSMLAEDLAPNRLERAKLAIRDCVETLEGDRVGLVAFAGSSAVKCPLTIDYGFFRMMLDQVSTGSIARGGTLIGDAIRKVLDEVFEDDKKAYKDIILITDGEDHDSFPVEAARLAGEKGVRLIAIGLGDENEGRPIPITDDQGNSTFLTYEGERVISRLDADTLRKMVKATPGGQYLNVATGSFDLGEIYQELVLAAEKKDLESETIRRYEEKFQIFLGVALVLLCLEWLISERPRAQPVNPAET